MEKIASKFECNLTKTTISTSTPKHTLHNHGSSGLQLRPSVKGELSTLVRNEEVAMRFMQNRDIKSFEEVQVLEISPALAEIINDKGIPLFGWW